MQWTNELTIAIVEENPLKIGQLIESIPSFEEECIETKKQVLALIVQAKSILEKHKNETLKTMQKIKQTKAFLLSDEAKNSRFIG